MSDNIDDQSMNFSETEEHADGAEPAAPKKKAAGGAGILKILMFAGIGIGAIFVVITISYITISIVNSGGERMTSIPVSEEYQTSTPVYAYSTNVGEVQTRTRDREPSSVIVKINIGFAQDDKETPNEITSRLPQIRDFLRNFFSLKYAAELGPDKEKVLKEELREAINRMLSKPGIKEVLFEKFQVILM